MGSAETELKTSECAEKIRLIRHYRVATADYNRAVQVLSKRSGTMRKAQYVKIREYVERPGFARKPCARRWTSTSPNTAARRTKLNHYRAVWPLSLNYSSHPKCYNRALVSYRRRHDYDLRLLPNRLLAELEEGVTCEQEAVPRSGLTIGYPGWNLLYYTALCSLRPDSYNLIIEIGTNWGCSTVCLAQALRDSGYAGRVHTVDISEANLSRAREYIIKAGLSDLIEIHCQDSLEFLTNLSVLDGQISFVFLDGGHHRDYLISEFT